MSRTEPRSPTARDSSSRSTARRSASLTPRPTGHGSMCGWACNTPPTQSSTEQGGTSTDWAPTRATTTRSGSSYGRPSDVLPPQLPEAIAVRRHDRRRICSRRPVVERICDLDEDASRLSGQAQRQSALRAMQTLRRAECVSPRPRRDQHPGLVPLLLGHLAHIGELLAFRDELFKQRRGLESVTHRPLELLHLRQYLVEADGVAVVHGAAAIDRPAIAVHPHHIDIGRPDRLLLVEDLRALVDHRVDAAFEDFLVADLARVLARLRNEVVDDLLGDGRWFRRPVLVIVVIAGAGLLAAAIRLAQDIADCLAVRFLLHPTDVEAGEIAHRERAHGKSEIVEHAIHIPWHRTLEHHLLGLAAALRQHAVADEAWADADQDGDLADGLGELHAGGDDFLGGVIGTHDLEQLHHIGRREEVQADDIFRPLGHRRDLVDVETRCVGCKDRAWFADGVELGEDLLLDVHALEYRLDDKVDVLELFEVQGTADQSHAAIDFRHRETA